MNATSGNFMNRRRMTSQDMNTSTAVAGSRKSEQTGKSNIGNQTFFSQTSKAANEKLALQADQKGTDQNLVDKKLAVIR